MTAQKYRKKPVVIDAVRNDGEWRPIIDWLDDVGAGRVPLGQTPTITRNADGTLDIYTLEGTMRAAVGDYIIRGVQGEFYPCKPDIFEATYEPVQIIRTVEYLATATPTFEVIE